MLEIGSLVSYKGKPAKIKNININKFEILFQDSTILKVREKDFIFIYPKYSPVNDKCPVANIEILKDFADQSLSVQEVTEWIFNEYSAQNAWCTYMLAKDGMYFYMQGKQVFIRDTQQVNKIKTQREIKLIEKESINKCIENINNNNISQADYHWLKEVELVAYNSLKHSKLLDYLKIQQTPESAHKFLINCAYWDNFHNPYPNRNSIYKNQEYQYKEIDIDREDLTYIKAYAIDNPESSDSDDAISIDKDIIWVHIADVATQAPIDSELDIYARKRISSLYLPDEVINMFPNNVVPFLSLGKDKYSKALSIGFRINNNDICDIKIIQSNIKVENITYDIADKILLENSDLSELNNIAKKYKQFRDENLAIKLELPNINLKILDDKVDITQQNFSPSREMIAEIMIITGRAIAQFALEKDIPMPYVTQDRGNFSDDITANKHNLTLSQMFSAMRCFKKSKISTKASIHFSLGLESYIRITSPIRRYLDLVAQQQIVNFINNKTMRTKEEIEEIITNSNNTMLKIKKTNKNSMDHFKFLFLKQNKKWQGTAVVVDNKNKKTILLIKSLAMFTSIKMDCNCAIDEEILLKVKDIDLEKLLVDFKPA